MRALLLLLPALARGLRSKPYAVSPYDGAIYSGPFTQLTPDYLASVSDPASGFGPEDKLLVCNDALVFIDLDNGTSTSLQYAYSDGVWSTSQITALPCPDSNEGSLVPRDSGYTVGQTAGPAGDRLLILGGSPGDTDENNVYYSDDCGLTFKCYDGDQIWSSRLFAPVVHAKGVLPGDPIVMAGGLSEVSQFPPSYLFSVGMFLSYDQGLHWQRPECELASNCSHPLPAPDTKGLQCVAEHDYYRHCFTLPLTPALPGALGADWDTLWLFYEAADTPEATGRVYHLGAPDLATGWAQDVGATDGGYGRKVFIRGGVPGSGCWFSTDYLAEDLWLFQDSDVASTNSFATARSALGPWVQWDGVGLSAPWAPRASAALTTDFAGAAAYFASGMTFVAGQGQLPGFGDAWQVDVGVCLLAPSSGKVCSGHGTPDLYNVVCVCAAPYFGAFCESSLPPVPGSPTPAPAPAASGSGRAAPPAVNVPGAVFGTLLALGATAAAVVYFLPTASFVVGGVTVVPAEVIRAGAGAAVGAAKAAGAAVSSLVSGAGAGAGSAAASPASAAAAPLAPASAAGEKASLLGGGQRGAL